MTQTQEILSFAKTAGITAKTAISGAKLTTICCGGELELLIEPNSADQLSSLLNFFYENKFEYRILGGGSNLLIPDSGVAVPVVRLGLGFRQCEELGAGSFYLGGSAALMTLSRNLSEAGFAGLEFAGGIPASLGGAVKMNAGAHGGEMSNIIACVDLVLASGEKQRLPAKELEFSYRHSVMPEGAIVIGAEIKLIPGVAAEISERRQNFLNDRKKNQPLTLPSCGSVFKNPCGSARAGELIEQCGLKGTRRGGAQISEKHGNWIVNPERQAKTADVLELIALCQTTVKSKTRIDLEREVRDLV